MENVAGEQDLALKQHFPYNTSKFSENFKRSYKLTLCLQGAQNLAILVFSMRSFHFWHSLSYSP